MKLRLIRLFIILSSFLLVLTVVILTMVAKKSSPSPTDRATLPTVKLPNLYQDTLPIKLEIDKKDVDIPQKAPTLTISTKPISKQSATKMATRLGFDFLPIEINDVMVGKKLFWKNELGFFSASLEIGEIYYGQHDLPKTPDKQLSDADILSTAESYLKTNFPNLSQNYKTSSIAFLALNENLEGGPVKVDQSKADYFNVELIPQQSELEIITLVPNSTPYFVSILPDGSVHSLRISSFKTSTTSEKEYKLKNFADITSSLNQASLVSIEGSFIPVSEIPSNSIQQITVTQISLAYLWEETNQATFLPVFLLKGPISITNINQEVKALLYLPALKNS